MQSVKIEFPSSKESSYNLHIGKGILEKLPSTVDLSKYSIVALVVDKNVADKRWFEEFLKSLRAGELIDPVVVAVAAGEESKSLDNLAALWREFLTLGLDRSSLLISVGGGAVCDLNGFAAGSYMRGIDFIHMPTTLLAQVDASIGGKVGINFGEIKNLLGLFVQPKAVLIDTDTLSTLPERELNAGFAEVIKHGLILDRKYYELVQSGYDKKRDETFLNEIILGSCRIKASIVKKDVKEAGLRKVLNFGHTIGHAVETLSILSPHRYLHGEAISIGMVAEAKLSEFLGFITHKEVLDIEDTLRDFNLPVRLGFEAGYEAFMEKIAADKKNTGNKTNWSLLEKIGRAGFNHQASQDQIRAAIDYISHV